MFDKERFINDYSLEGLTAEEQDALYEDFTYELGAAISDGLSDAQIDEFTQIINGNDGVIGPWLAANAPDYRDDPSFKELSRGYDEDPERISPDKVFASILWIRVNRPDYDRVLARVRAEFKHALDANVRP